jgi:hypothetical protein
MKAFIPAILLFFITPFAFAQAEDTVVVPEEFDTTTLDYGDQYEAEEDSEYSTSTYTQRPGELRPTKEELNRPYTEKKFSKTEWKRIVGETNYTEDQLEEKKKEEEKSKPYRGSSLAWNPAVLKIAGYVLITVLIGAVIYYLFKNAMQDKGTGKSTLNTDPLLYDNRHIDEVGEDDIEKLLRDALERNDFRAAVRIYYIRLLKHLHSTGFIAWKKDKTNRDYAAELATVSFTRDFRKLMTAYEIIWYGERTPSLEEFRKLQVNFNDLQHQANRTA